MRNFFIYFLLFYCSFYTYSQNSIPHVEFSITSSKDEVMEGECTLINASLIISSKNKIPLNFGENFTSQMINLREQILKTSTFHCEKKYSSMRINEYSKNDEYFKQYMILEVALCPYDVDIIKIPSLEFNILRTDSDTSKVTIKSKSVTIKINKTPKDINDNLYQNNGYELVGDYKIEDKLDINKYYYSVGDTLSYTVNVSGNGNLFPLDMTLPKSNLFSIIKSESEFGFDLEHKEFTSYKTFRMDIVPIVEGTLKMQDFINWNYYSVENKKIENLETNTLIHINNSKVKPNTISNTVNNIVFAVDVSKSMKISDYNNSTRISKAIQIGNELSEDGCMQMYAFDQLVYDIPGCSLGKENDILELSKFKGTAIGNVIWRAIKKLKNKEGNKSLIIISDGEENAGNITASKAANIAKKYGVKIYTIGVGHQGKVPYYMDNGVEVLVENTYVDKTLKEITAITNGKHFWLEYENQITEIVQEILELSKR